MKIGEYKKISEEIVENIVMVDDFDAEGNIIGQHEETVRKVIPVMGIVYREMTEEEVAQAEADAEQAKADAEQREKAEANDLIQRLIAALGTADTATVGTFKGMFDGIKVVFDPDNPIRWIEGMTPVNNAYYRKDDGKVYVYMDGNWIEW